MTDCGFASSERRYIATPWVARRTFSKVKSRAIRPRQPEVPKVIICCCMLCCVLRSAWWWGRDTQHVPSRSVFPVESLFLERVNVTDEQDGQKTYHRSENQIAGGRISQHLPIDDCPGIQKNHFDIEEDKEHRDQVKLHRQSRAAFADRNHAALVSRILGSVAFAA